MLMTSFLKGRKSVRDFKDTKIKETEIKKIQEELNSLKDSFNEYDIDLKLYENGKIVSKGLEGKGGYSGVMIESPHYIALRTTDENKSKMMGAYYMEKMISFLQGLEISTCWLTINEVEPDVKSEVLGETYKDTDFLLALGYPERKDPFEEEKESPRKPIKDIVFQEEIGKNADLNDLEVRGLLDLFYYIRYAPSQKNLQPWRFLVEGDKITLLMEKDVGSTPMDAGIVMYYFEELLKTIGVSRKWNIVDFEEIDGHIKVAEISI